MKITLTLLFILINFCSAMSQQKKTINYLALGDSYTIGESVSEADRWPNQLAEALRQQGYKVGKPKIIATTGWRTDNLKNAMNIARLKPGYDLVSLLIGVNNQYQHKSIDQFAKEFEGLLNETILLSGGKKENVFVVSIPDYGFTPYGKSKQTEITKELDAFNEISKKITEKHQVKYINITDLSRKGLDDASLVAEDGLHPSGKMYSLWTQRIVEQLKVKR